VKVIPLKLYADTNSLVIVVSLVQKEVRSQVLVLVTCKVCLDDQVLRETQGLQLNKTN